MPEASPSDATNGENRTGKIEIAKLDGIEEGIDDKTRIIRYMKLETFVLSLAHQVFIPSHEAGVCCGKVAAASYVNLEEQNADTVFSNWENAFFPHLLKSVSFEYEKEIRFILRAHYDIIKVQKGVMVEIDTSSIIFPDADVTVSPQLQREERVAVEKMIEKLIKECREGLTEPLKLNEDWAKLYAQYKR